MLALLRIIYHQGSTVSTSVKEMSRFVRKPTIWFPNRCDINEAVQPQKQARSSKFQICEEEEVYYPCSKKTKALISFAVTVKLICVFVFAYADCWFPPGPAQI